VSNKEEILQNICRICDCIGVQHGNNHELKTALLKSVNDVGLESLPVKFLARIEKHLMSGE